MFPLADEDSSEGFGGPTTVVTGRQDRIVGFADQYGQMPLYPRGTFAALDDAGHYLPFEQPAMLRGLVREWLRRCEQER